MQQARDVGSPQAANDALAATRDKPDSDLPGEPWATGVETDQQLSDRFEQWVDSQPSRLTPEEVATVAAQINRGVAKFESQGGTVQSNLTEDQKIEALGVFDAQVMAGDFSSNSLGPNFTRAALVDPVMTTNVATVGGDIAGAHGFYTSSEPNETATWGGDQIVGHGIFGSTGIVEGAGSALVAEYIKQAADDGNAIVIRPVADAVWFWRKMGMVPGTAGYDWGMTANDAMAVANLLD